mgnify:CR=1 FL=1
MKQKHLLIRFFFAIVLLASIVAQSFHGFEHLEKKFSEKICLHKHTNSAELTHQHKGFEQCLVCTISFQNGITEKQFYCQLQPEYHFVSNYSFTFSTIISFSGSLYSLRGPPQYIV